MPGRNVPRGGRSTVRLFDHDVSNLESRAHEFSQARVVVDDEDVNRLVLRA
jgi:hypothetical protein